MLCPRCGVEVGNSAVLCPVCAGERRRQEPIDSLAGSVDQTKAFNGRGGHETRTIKAGREEQKKRKSSSRARASFRGWILFLVFVLVASIWIAGWLFLGAPKVKLAISSLLGEEKTRIGPSLREAMAPAIGNQYASGRAGIIVVNHLAMPLQSSRSSFRPMERLVEVAFIPSKERSEDLGVPSASDLLENVVLRLRFDTNEGQFSLEHLTGYDLRFRYQGDEYSFYRPYHRQLARFGEAIGFSGNLKAGDRVRGRLVGEQTAVIKDRMTAVEWDFVIDTALDQ